jgi:hypothetical protein
MSDFATHHLAFGFAEYFGRAIREMGKHIPNEEVVGLMFDAYVGGMLKGVEVPEQEKAAVLTEIKRYQTDIQSMIFQH